MSESMKPWLHFGHSDFLIFKAWRPSSHGAVAGACIGLLLFCILERCLAAYRRVQESHWRTKAVSRSSTSKKGRSATASSGATPLRRQPVPPFIPSHDVSRGVIQAIQSTCLYSLMLAVMTFNSAYIIAIILGLGLGEILFGRVGRK